MLSPEGILNGYLLDSPKSLYHTNGTKIGRHRVVDPNKKNHASKARKKQAMQETALDLFSFPKLQARNTTSMKNHHTTEIDRKNTLEKTKGWELEKEDMENAFLV